MKPPPVSSLQIIHIAIWMELDDNLPHSSMGKLDNISTNAIQFWQASLYETNPNNAQNYKGNPSKLPYVLHQVWFPLIWVPFNDSCLNSTRAFQDVAKQPCLQGKETKSSKTNLAFAKLPFTEELKKQLFRVKDGPVIWDYFINHDIRIPSINNQDSMESQGWFFEPWLNEAHVTQCNFWGSMVKKEVLLPIYIYIYIAS